MESIIYFLLQEQAALIHALFRRVPFQLQRAFRHNHDVQFFIHGNKTAGGGKKNNLCSFFCYNSSQSCYNDIIKPGTGKYLNPPPDFVFDDQKPL